MTRQGIVAIASLAHGASVADILGARRLPYIVKARWAAWRLAHISGWSIAKIAQEFGVNWSTVKHALDKAK